MTRSDAPWPGVNWRAQPGSTRFVVLGMQTQKALSGFESGSQHLLGVQAQESYFTFCAIVFCYKMILMICPSYRGFIKLNDIIYYFIFKTLIKCCYILLFFFLYNANSICHGSAYKVVRIVYGPIQLLSTQHYSCS